jgi:hypothetical protein
VSVVELERYDIHQKRDPDGKWGDGIPGPSADLPGMSLDDYLDSYDIHDETPTSSGLLVATMTDGDMQLGFDDPAHPDRRRPLLDVDERDMLKVRHAVQQAVDSAEDGDWELDDDGDVWLRVSAHDDGVSLEFPGEDFDVTIDHDEADEFLDALDEQLDRVDEVDRARYVRTEAGARRYGLPIGSPIGGGGARKAAKKVVAAVEKSAPARKTKAGTSRRKDYQPRQYHDVLEVNGKPITENAALRGSALPHSALDARGTAAADLWTDGTAAARWAKMLRSGVTGWPIRDRSGNDHDLAQMTADMDHAVSQGRLNADAVLWRGVVMEPADVERLFPVGGVFSDPAYAATAAEKPGAERMLDVRRRETSLGQPYLMRVHAPAGTNAAPGADPVREVVLGRDTRMRVHDVQPPSPNSPGLITVEVLP